MPRAMQPLESILAEDKTANLSRLLLAGVVRFGDII